jgi:N-ethylmaleimide reductase
LREITRAMIDVRGSDRVGVQLAPFAWMSRLDDELATGFYGPLLNGLAEMELAYLHLSGAMTPDRGDFSTTRLGKELRRAFPGMLIGSGIYSPESAVATVESRWADAIGFTLAAGRGDKLVRAITATSAPPRTTKGPGAMAV